LVGQAPAIGSRYVLLLRVASSFNSTRAVPHVRQRVLAFDWLRNRNNNSYGSVLGFLSAASAKGMDVVGGRLCDGMDAEHGQPESPLFTRPIVASICIAFCVVRAAG